MRLWGVFKDVQEVSDHHRPQHPAFDTHPASSLVAPGDGRRPELGAREAVAVSVLLSPALSPSEQLDSQRSW